mmetsp:Transcript_5441/g.16223  ORF Transcript_5441/g.16223 Transcript_5441/m.16223 type:complete len:133 (-) Transcript_5441:83-481(-)
MTQFIGDGGTAGMVPVLPRGHKDRWQSFWKEQWRQEYAVPCEPLKDMLASHAVSHIDLLSVDTSGADWVVLRSLDFERVHIRVILTELGRSSRDAEAREFLRQNGFCFAIAVAQNEFWTSDPELKKRFCPVV